MKPFHKIEDFSIKSYQAFLHITFVFNGCDPSKLGSTPDVKKFGFEFFFFLELHHSVELLNNCYFQERVILDEFPKHRYKKNHHLDVFFNPKSVIYNYIFYFITFC